MAITNDPLNWEDDDNYWRSNYGSRPYADKSRDYEAYRPGYRYGYESANRYEGRSWDDVEGDLSKTWNTYEHRGTSTWEQVKGAVRDAWDRVTGKRPVNSP